MRTTVTRGSSVKRVGFAATALIAITVLWFNVIVRAAVHVRQVLGSELDDRRPYCC